MIRELVASVVGYQGHRVDTSKLDGTPRKLLDVSRIRALGWRPEVRLLRAGVEAAYAWFCEQEVVRT